MTFQVVETAAGERLWIGRYVPDLLEYLMLYHPEGVLAAVEGEVYKVVVTPAGKTIDHG